MRAHCAKAAERINVLFGVETLGIKETLYQIGVFIPHDKGRGFDAAFAKLLWPLELLFCTVDITFLKTKQRFYKQDRT